MKSIFVALLALTLSVPALAGGHRLDDATSGLQCYQAPVGVETEHAGVYLDPTHRKLFGEIESTLLITDENQLVAIAFNLGAETPKYKQSHRLYKYLVRNYGEPFDANVVWLWFPPTGLTFAMGAGNQPNTIIFAIYCN
jgi:hypothetical protein